MTFRQTFQRLSSALLICGGIACTTPPAATTSNSAGSLAISGDGRQLYIADADNARLIIADPVKQEVVRTIPVGREPSHVVVGSDGRVFVSNRQDRSVSVIDPKAGVELARVKVGTEPTGLALSKSGDTLLVANTTNNTVSVIDVPTLTVRQTIATAADPSGVAYLPDGRAYVTHLRSGTVSVLAPGATGVEGSPFPLNLNTAIASTRTPSQPVTPVITPGGRAYIAISSSDTTPITTTPDQTDVPTGGSAYGGGGSDFNFRPPVVTPGLATVDITNNTVMTGTSDGLGTSGANAAVPAALLLVRNQPLNGPSAAIMDPSGKFLYVVHMNSNNVAVISLGQPNTGGTAEGPVPTIAPGGAFSSSITAVADVGGGPNGIAIPASGDRAYVYNSFDHTISVLKAKSATEVRQDTFFAVGDSALTPQQQLGRRLFFSASDSRMTNPSAGGIACASCHPSGREDGRTWQFTEGPRNTPTLAGRHLVSTAPYHWDGQLATMHDFNSVIVNRMGGAGDGVTGTDDKVAPLDDTDFNAILAFLDSQSPPDNPFKDSTDAATLARGRVVFDKAACSSCHQENKDFQDNDFHDVGTVGLTAQGFLETFPRDGLVNTPTLHNLFATAPYLHDGSKATLRDRVLDDAGGRHGVTSNLSRQEVDDLVAYLNTL